MVKVNNRNPPLKRFAFMVVDMPIKVSMLS